MKKKTLMNLLMLAVSLAIVGYLLYDVHRSDKFELLLKQPKNWWLLASAWGLFFASLLVTFFRWYVLVRALELPFRFRDALRLGFLGYLFNFVSLGSVGGDLFKAIFIAREQPGRRTEAVSTVIVDRLLGLYGLVLLGSIVVLLSGQLGRAHPSVRSPIIATPAAAGGLSRSPSPGLGSSPENEKNIRALAIATLALTGGMTLVFGVMLLPGCTYGPVSIFLSELPKVGHFVRDLLRAARVYRSRHGVLLAMLALTVFQHTLNVLGFFCIAHGLSGAAPGLVDHFRIVPLGIISSAIPLPFMALGAFDGFMKALYAVVAAPGTNLELGLLVALVYRVFTLLDALIGIFFWLGERREVSQVMHEVEELELEEESEPTVEIRHRS